MNALLRWSLVIGILLEITGSGIVIASAATYTPVKDADSEDERMRHIDAELTRNRDMARIGAGVLLAGLVFTATRLVYDARRE
jgi:dTDP-4-dehydrorhamnose reductase